MAPIKLGVTILTAALFGGFGFGRVAAQTALSSAPATFGVADRHVILVLQGVGAQIYECKAGVGPGLSWVFREPSAGLFETGKSTGRHFSGPTWALLDGSQVQGKVAATAPGATTADVAWLKLEVTQNAGIGVLKDATTVLRLDTAGGALSGPCPATGALRAQAYSANYVFLR